MTEPGPAAPHPPLTRFYGTAAERDPFVRRLFAETADVYDRINAACSFGSGGWYRRQALRRAGLRPGDRVLDVAVGTGLVAREALRVLGGRGEVTGLDLSPEMLRQARRGLPIRLVAGRAEALPLGDAAFDFLSMGYALRHVASLPVAFAEYRRVLRPGGRLLLLEIARPEGRLAYAAARFYLGRVVPAVSARLGGGRRGGEGARRLMQYYWDTIDHCVPPAAILDALRQAGFRGVGCEAQFGLFRAYVAQRPTGPDGAP
ncbi:class I SAM-dependent methyltransferase [Roseicella frigidaeris]|uniref:Dimethylmenaquinone methyltransferase n=1 Tax=Roseicella frigidaeris TaxID=2230885 RepID=A0A327MDQ1_9PROT|nr:class I SAM-dependent methyltransferase [Roseicella frigidaeris]RAI58318.1 dimethylmenaquinone methyltransferase [Roseicella frigidaeris]